MDCTNNNVWGEELICGKHGNCIIMPNGLGVCNCTDGYTHDMLYMRQRDCSVPTSTQPFFVFNMVAIAYSVVMLIVIIYHILHASSLARIFLKVLGITSFITIWCYVSHYLVGNKNHPVPFFFFTIMMSFAFVQAYIMLYSQIIPLYRISNLDPGSFIRRCILSFSLFRVISFALVAISIPYADFNKIENDRVWNILVMVNIFLIGIEVGMVNLQMMFEITDLLKQIDELSTFKETETGKRTRGLKKYVEKLRRLKAMIATLAPMAVPPMLVVPIIYFATGYFPYQWVIQMCTTTMFLLGTIEYVRYGATGKVNGTQDASGKEPSGKEASGKVTVMSLKHEEVVKTSDEN